MRHAFSLVELSIVLVILGLLTGGILSGQSLIRAAELRSVSTDISRATTAVYSFRDKYFQLPGDFTSATSFWTSCTNGTNNNCNGNGNGDLEVFSCTSVQSAEINRAWQHLALAGLVEGDYSTGLNVACSGSSATAPYNGIPGVTVPKLRLSSGGIMFYPGTSWYGYKLNVILVGAYDGINNSLEGALLKPEEAWNLDTKMDDGKASAGAMRGFVATTGTCLTAGEYALTATAAACRMAMALR